MDNNLTGSLATLAEIAKQNIVPLDVLKRYRLADLICTSEESRDLFEQLKNHSRSEGPFGTESSFSVILWSFNDIQVYAQRVDQPTVVVYRNKYGQFYPIVDQLGKFLHYPGPEAEQSSFLLLRLLNEFTKRCKLDS